MEDEELRTKICEVKSKISPLFNINQEQLEKFQSPIIIRDYREQDYLGRDKSWAGFDSLRNILYFPNQKNFNSEKLKNPSLLTQDHRTYESVFEEEWLIPPIASYIHHQINSGLKKFSLELDLKKYNLSSFDEKTGKYNELIDLVREYPNIILGNRDIYDDNIRICFRKVFHLFINNGPEFLPELSRMSVEDAIKKGILNY